MPLIGLRTGCPEVLFKILSVNGYYRAQAKMLFQPGLGQLIISVVFKKLNVCGASKQNSALIYMILIYNIRKNFISHKFPSSLK